MRHRNKKKTLGRTSAHRSAMLSNMATSLIMHKRIFTTVPKAKELRRFVEPIITASKEDTTNARRLAFSKLKNKYAVTELFQTVSQKVGDRPGGYTRILKTGQRLGDNASMCFIELVDFNENMLSEKDSKKTRTRRSRRRGGAAATTASTTTVTGAAEATKDDTKATKTTKVVKEDKKSEPATEVEKKVDAVETELEVEVTTEEAVQDKKAETESVETKEVVEEEVKDNQEVVKDSEETAADSKD